ncbi:MAG: hypothetical protein ABUL47_05970, partial [Leifsonia sp.]
MILACGLVGDSIRDANAENKSRAKGARGVKGVVARGSVAPGARSKKLLSVEGLTIAFKSAE